MKSILIIEADEISVFIAKAVIEYIFPLCAVLVIRNESEVKGYLDSIKLKSKPDLVLASLNTIAEMETEYMDMIQKFIKFCRTIIVGVSPLRRDLSFIEGMGFTEYMMKPLTVDKIKKLAI